MNNFYFPKSQKCTCLLLKSVTFWSVESPGGTLFPREKPKRGSSTRGKKLLALWKFFSTTKDNVLFGWSSKYPCENQLPFQTEGTLSWVVVELCRYTAVCVFLFSWVHKWVLQEFLKYIRDMYISSNEKRLLLQHYRVGQCHPFPQKTTTNTP